MGVGVRISSFDAADYVNKSRTRGATAGRGIAPPPPKGAVGGTQDEDRGSQSEGGESEGSDRIAFTRNTRFSCTESLSSNPKAPIS